MNNREMADPHLDWSSPNDEPIAVESSEDLVDGSIGVEEHICATVLIFLALLTLANVLVRYFSNLSFAFTEEVSVSLLVVVSLFGSAAAFRRNNHLRIEWLTGRANLDRWLEIASSVSALVLFGALSWYAALMTLDEYEFGVRSSAMNVPNWLLIVALPVGSVLIVWRVAQRLVSVLRGGA